MKTTGQILGDTRRDKRLELADISRITRIRPQFLSAIEADDYGQLPSGAVAKGFIRNYAEFLELNPDYILAVFRRDFVENDAGQIIPRGMVEPVNKSNFWTPKTTIIAGLVMLFTLFGAYLFYQYRLLIGPPSLELSEPAEGIAVIEPTVVISGRTDPEATLSVNSELIALEKGGFFIFRLPLNPGPNDIQITATGKSGKTNTITRRVIYQVDNNSPGTIP